METVKAAKSFIEAELAKYGTWEEWEKAAACSTLFDSEASFSQAKAQGVGRAIIHTFLGKQWSRYLVEITLGAASRRGRRQGY